MRIIYSKNTPLTVQERNASTNKYRNYKHQYKLLSGNGEVIPFYDKRVIKSKWGSFLCAISTVEYVRFKKLIVKGPVTLETYPTPDELPFLNEEQATLYYMFYEEFLNYMEIHHGTNLGSIED